MESLYFLVPCALIFIAIAIKILFWAINNGQYDNLDTEAHRILFDEKDKVPAQKNPDASNPATDAPNSATDTSSPVNSNEQQ